MDDDVGVTRRGLLSRRAMRWGEIDDYRIVARIPRGSLEVPFDDLVRFGSSLAGQGRLAHSIELRSGERRLRIDAFFADMPRVIGEIPTLHAALAVARELAYPVRDGETVRVLAARS